MAPSRKNNSNNKRSSASTAGGNRESANVNKDDGKEPVIEKEKTSLKDHNNWFVRSGARVGYTVWIVVMAVGLLLAFIVSLFLL